MTEEELQVLIDASIANVPKYADLPAPSASSTWADIPGSGTHATNDIAKSLTTNRLYCTYFTPPTTRSYDGWSIDVTNSGTAAQFGVVECDPDTEGWPFLNPGIIAQDATNVASTGVKTSVVTEFELVAGHLYAMFAVGVSLSLDRIQYTTMNRFCTSWLFLQGAQIYSFYQRTADSVTPATFTEPLTAMTGTTVSIEGQDVMMVLNPV
jgi:hypothetical protein